MTTSVSCPIGDDRPVPRVSVLVVNYRAYAELDCCLHSLLDQAGLSSVIVVDHASVRDQCAALEARYPNVTWLARHDNPGFGAGVNFAARQASGDYLYVVNPDAVVGAGAVLALSRWLDTHPNVGVAGSLVRDSDGTIQGSARRFPTFSTLFAGRSSWLTRRFPANPLSRMNVLTGPHVTEPRQVDWVSGASMMIRRKAFDAVGGFDERYFLYWEDADFCRRLLSCGWHTAYVPQAEIVHHGSRSSRSQLRPMVAFHRSAFRYYFTHSGRLGTLASPFAAAVLTLRLAWKVIARGRGHEAAR